jgi:two-component system chemotaxis response regulator CheB
MTMGVERKIRVMIVEDSATVRMLLEKIIGGDPRLEVAASVATAEEALRVLPAVKPDVISLDIRLPGMNGFEATRRIMTEQPTPIVVVSASVEAEDLKISMNALSAGALTVVEKPTGTTSVDYSTLAERLCRQLVIMSDVSVVRQRRGRAARNAPAAQRREKRPAFPSALRADGYRALGIVASTGGPNAVLTVLQALGPDYPLPVLLVQHITPSFLGGFVAWLDDVSPLKVIIARDGEPALPGHVYVSAQERHLELDGWRVRNTDGPPVSGQKPSGTVLLRSMAQSLGSRALAVLLTGMGDDGAEGLKAVQEAGGHTIAEDESTAVVYGMPAAAVRLGAVNEQLPLHRIGLRLREISQPEQVAI